MSIIVQSLANEILNSLENRKEIILGFLESLVKAESPSTIIQSHALSQTLILDKLKSLGYYTIKIPGQKTGGHIYARPKSYEKNKAKQLLIGHSDTVWPMETLQNMAFEFEDGMIRGPGVYDMKAGLTQILFALDTLNEIKVELPLSPVVFINSDEEIGSLESTKYIEWLAKIAERAFILEPPLGLDGKLKTRRKGVGRFTIEVFGKAAHAGLDPTKGASAILELSHQIQKFFEMNDLEKGISVNVGLIEGGVRPNVIAATSRAVIDVRVPSMEDAQIITKKIYGLKASTSQYEIVIRGSVGRMPLEQTPRNLKLWTLAKREGKKLGVDLDEGFAGGGSDGNTTSLYTATLDGLGTPGDGAHAIHEFAYADKIIERTALLCLLLASDSTV